MKQNSIKIFDDPQNLAFIHLTDSQISQDFLLQLKSSKSENIDNQLKNSSYNILNESKGHFTNLLNNSSTCSLINITSEPNFKYEGNNDKETISSQNENDYLKDYINRMLKQMKVYKKYLKKNYQVYYKRIPMPKSKFKYTLCIDLDETLVYCDFEKKFKDHNYVYKGIIEEKYVKLGINFRPGLKDFLLFASEKYELILFTCSLREYADMIMDIIDPHYNYFSYRLYREDCIDICNNVYTKDLNIFFNRNTSNIILIDNCLVNMLNQLDNGYLISPFNNDKNDKELYKLIDFLNKNDSNLNEALKNKFNLQRRFDSS